MDGNNKGIMAMEELLKQVQEAMDAIGKKIRDPKVSKAEKKRLLDEFAAIGNQFEKDVNDAVMRKM